MLNAYIQDSIRENRKQKATNHITESKLSAIVFSLDTTET